MSLEDRLRRLEKQMARLDVPSLEEVGAAFRRATERARSRFRGEPEPFVDQSQDDQDAIGRWARATGVDLDTEAQRAKQMLLDVGRRPT